MKFLKRIPLAVFCLVLGGTVALFVSDRLQGQAVPPIMPKEISSYRDVVKRVVPAVVSIEAKATKRVGQPRTRSTPNLPNGMPEEFRKFFEGFGAMEELEPRFNPNLGFGSGVVIDPDGVILTNFHVVNGADTLDITFDDGRKFTTSDILHDPKTDLAIVRIKPDRPLPALEFGDSDAMQVGDRVLAVGAPFGLTGTVTQGIVSAKSRQNLRLNQYEDFIQTDAAMNPGNSGGPLVNLEGKIVGINSAIKTRSGGSNGIGLAVSSNLARDVSRQLLDNGVVRRGYIGVSVRQLDSELAARLSVPSDHNAVMVTQVFPNTPSSKAGLKAGDVILSVGGIELKDLNTLPRVVAKLPINKQAEVVFLRDGKQYTQPVTIEEQPEEYGLAERMFRGGSTQVPTDVGVSVAGLTVADMTSKMASELGFPRDARGAIILSVKPDSAAAEAGLMKGLLITKVDRTPIATAEQFASAMKQASKEKGALLLVTRATGESDYVILKTK